MGISFGSTGIKPYVGSKEVQEAYVGSQLVYQSGPPYYYAFLGGETSYYLANWVNLNGGLSGYSASCAIVKDGVVWKITNGSGVYASLRFNENPHKIIKFTAKKAGLGTVSSAITLVGQPLGGGTDTTLKTFNMTGNQYGQYSFTIPSNYTLTHMAFSSAQVWLDEIRFEET